MQLKCRPKKLMGYDLMHEGALAFADLESNGICIDTDFLRARFNANKKKIQKTREDILKSNVGKIWRKEYGVNSNPQSTEQLGKILFDIMGYKTDIKTKGDKNSTSKTSLEKIDHPVVTPIVQKVIGLRELVKMNNTYIKGILDETINGVLHPFFNLHTTNTYRSSSSNINFQNIPIRNPKQKWIRKGFIPRQDHGLLEIDYSGQEVRIAACYNKDPNLIDDIINPEKDMHGDMAVECFKLKRNQFIGKFKKKIRYLGKNNFVFPEFYGSFYMECAKNLWENSMSMKMEDGILVHEHLRKQGIHNLEEFTNHIQQVEDYFWNRRYPTYTEWKEKHYQKYLKTGEVESLTGFTYRGVMRRNQVINFPIQGSAFHCLLWAVIYLNKEFKLRRLDSKICGQIHDSIFIDYHPDELNEIMELIDIIAIDEIQNHYDFLTIPLDVEKELCRPNESWSEKREVVENRCIVCDCNYAYEEEHHFDCPLCGDKQEKEMEVVR